MTSTRGDIFWAQFYGRDPRHAYPRSGFGASESVRSLCGASTALPKVLVLSESGKQCRRCLRIAVRIARTQQGSSP